MERKLYMVYDIVAKRSMPVFEASNDREAVRIFRNAYQEMSKSYGFDFYNFKIIHVGVISADEKSIISAGSGRYIVDQEQCINELEFDESKPDGSVAQKEFTL